MALLAGAFAWFSWQWGLSLFLLALTGSLVSLGALRPRLLAVAALILLFVYSLDFSRPQDTDLPLGETLRLRGEIIEDPLATEKGFKLLVKLSAAAPGPPEGGWRPVGGVVALTLDGAPTPAPARGDEAVFRSQLSPPWGFRNPGSLWHEFYIARKGIIARAHAKADSTAIIAKPLPENDYFHHFRNRVSQAISDDPSDQPRAVVKALAVGDRSALSADTYELFRRTGTIHILSVSGLHLTIVLLMAMKVFRWLLVRITPLAIARPVEPLARLGALMPVIAYALFAGLSIATLRSLLMAALVVVSAAFLRRISMEALLMGTAFLILLLNPLSLTDPGFQLTFGALAGLLWLPDAIRKIWTKEDAAPKEKEGRARKAGSLIFAAFLTSFSATLMTAPLTSFNFGQGSWSGALYNCVAVPVSGFLTLPLTLLGTLAFPVFPPLADLCWQGAGFTVSLLLGLFRFSTPQEGGQIFQPFATHWGLMGFYGLVYALASTRQSRRARCAIGAAALAFLAAVPAYSRISDAFEKNASFWVLDVGDGQAVAMKLPGPTWVVLDGGGLPGSNFDVGKAVVWPALTALGCEKLDLVISSHPHPDHLGGIPSLAALAKPSEFWLPESFRGDPRYAETLREASRAGGKIRWITPFPEGKAVFEAGGYEITAFGGQGGSENERCLMVSLTGNGQKALFPSDLEAKEQARLLGEGFDPSGTAVLLAPHHGSSDSVHPNFLNLSAPGTVIASTGNRRSLPSPELKYALAHTGASLVSTSESGAVRVRLGPDGAEVVPFVDRTGIHSVFYRKLLYYFFFTTWLQKGNKGTETP